MEARRGRSNWDPPRSIESFFSSSGSTASSRTTYWPAAMSSGRSPTHQTGVQFKLATSLQLILSNRWQIRHKPPCYTLWSDLFLVQISFNQRKEAAPVTPSCSAMPVFIQERVYGKNGKYSQNVSNYYGVVGSLRLLL